MPGVFWRRKTSSGVAHLVEHMAFNGTEKYNQQEIIAYFESIGMRFGTDLNAYTSFDETVYMLNFPSQTTRRSWIKHSGRIVDQWISHVSLCPRGSGKRKGGGDGGVAAVPMGAEARVRDSSSCPYLYTDSRYAERAPHRRTLMLLAGVSRAAGH
jgi:zinc protease